MFHLKALTFFQTKMNLAFISKILRTTNWRGMRWSRALLVMAVVPLCPPNVLTVVDFIQQ